MSSTRLFLFISIFVISCKSEKSKVEEKSLNAIKIFFNANIIKEPEFKSLDSLRIIKIDSVTEKFELSVPIRFALNSADKFNNLTELATSLAKNKQTIANLGATMYGGYVNKLEYEAAAEERLKSKNYSDSATFYINLADKFIKLKAKADSTTLLYYGVQCLYQFSKKDLTFERDSAVIILTKEFNIVEEKQIVEKYIKRK